MLIAECWLVHMVNVGEHAKTAMFTLHAYENKGPGERGERCTEVFCCRARPLPNGFLPLQPAGKSKPLLLRRESGFG